MIGKGEKKGVASCMMMMQSSTSRPFCSQLSSPAFRSPLFLLFRDEKTDMFFFEPRVFGAGVQFC
jgi:hypothetical protein